MSNRLFLFFVLLVSLRAQPLPVVDMQMDPNQLAQSLRTRQPVMSAADCRALDLLECLPDEPTRAREISLRWVSLDDGPEREAILVANGKAENIRTAYVFRKQGSWKMIGAFFCRQVEDCDLNALIRVQKLTRDSPLLVLIYRDLGGSGSAIMNTSAFVLRGGALWPAFEYTNDEQDLFPEPSRTRGVLRASNNRLVLQTIREKPPGRIQGNSCDIWRWSASEFRFVTVSGERGLYCDVKMGVPLETKSRQIDRPLQPR